MEHERNEACKEQFVSLKEQIVEMKAEIKEIKTEIREIPQLSILVESMTNAIAKQSDTNEKLNDSINGINLNMRKSSNSQ